VQGRGSPLAILSRHAHRGVSGSNACSMCSNEQATRWYKRLNGSSSLKLVFFDHTCVASPWASPGNYWLLPP
jgi:hypothetical protein